MDEWIIITKKWMDEWIIITKKWKDGSIKKWMDELTYKLLKDLGLKILGISEISRTSLKWL